MPLAELVREAAEDAVYLAQPHGIRVALTSCDEASVTGDRHRLRQLLLILTDNAVKYNRPGGDVSIALRARGDTAEIEIVNDGEGIDAETGRKLFRRFVRGDNAKEKVEGCGLGLNIAQWIVKAHGGSIQLVSGPEGKTTSLVTLPTRATNE